MSENKETPQAPGDEQKTKQSERSSSGGGGGGRERSRRRHHQPQQSQQRRPEASLNMDELRELVELIAEHGFTDFELEREGFRVRLGRELAPQMPAPSMPSAQTSTHAIGQTSAPATATSAAASQPSTGGATQSSSGSPPPDGMSEEGAAAAVADEENLHIITSPIVGTFYRSASPTADVFVRIGSHINADTIVCIIEAMKLMNEIPAETSGEVVKIYVENGQPVEYGQPLFGIKK